MWPQILEFNVGQAGTLETQAGLRTIVVRGIEHEYQPDLWCRENPTRRTLRAARIRVEVSGEAATLTARPYAMPVVVNGVRLYVETTRQWAREVGYNPMEEMVADVRLSALDASVPWGPEGLVFPIAGYRWRSSTYQNTWSSLVPYNIFYYHRGDDFGAIPDRLPVRAVQGGTVIESPLPQGDGKSNGLIIGAGGIAWRYAHMNTECIRPDLAAGQPVAAGERLGLTGCTWSGARTQHSDPHLHVDLKRDGSYASTYPFLVQAYLNSYDDPALAIAGGFTNALPGEEVVLDATRSIVRPGRRLAAVRWRLHDGRTVEEAVTTLVPEGPGLYAEELSVVTDDGREVRDYLNLRVFDPGRGRDMATGFVYHTPVRGITPGARVLFWNRLRNTASPVTVDFGDGTAPMTIGAEGEHAYARPGLYTVIYSATGPADEPVMAKMGVVVEPF